MPESVAGFSVAGCSAASCEFQEEDEGRIDTSSFTELRLDSHQVEAAQEIWTNLLNSIGSVEAAGEAIYATLFDAAPALQSMFTTPRAVQAIRFANSLNHTVRSLNDPAQLKVVVETLGFQHMSWEITIPRVVVFRDAILNLFEVELEENFTPEGRSALVALLNYIGGAMIYVGANYADRLRILVQSWVQANQGSDAKVADSEATPEAAPDDDQGDAVSTSEERSQGQSDSPSPDKRRGNSRSSEAGSPARKVKKQTVPKTFKEMFQFNSAVMGFGNRVWMKEVLACLGDIVMHAAETTRLQQECDILALRISKCGGGHSTINLAEFKSCMLASLRSLLPKQWNSSCEVAWNWFWGTVEVLLRSTLGSPPAWEAALEELLDSMDDSQKYEMRSLCYQRFFAAAPAGQDHFKQSTTRLHFIAERVMQMPLALLRDPWRLVSEISALGLRHVGYGISTELFSPFVNSYIEALAAVSSASAALTAFRWSLNLISKILVRTVDEGSTIVMKAINMNSTKQLMKAISCAPRGERAKWLLIVQVGTQSISPLSWAIESGSLEAADAMIKDLLTIRADRRRYYYGLDELFCRHPDIVERLSVDAPSLLPTLLEGLVWRSRQTKGGKRRANYYVKHLLLNSEGNFSDCLKHLVALNDPQIISHPVVIFVSDTLWSGVVRHQFITSRIWFILSLLIMMLSHVILPKLKLAADQKPLRILSFVGRVTMYALTMSRLLFTHLRGIASGLRRKETAKFGCVPVPKHLWDPYNASGLVLALLLLLMAIHEPMFQCLLWSGADWPSESCQEAKVVEFPYSIFCMCAMGLHWLMLMDMAVFNTGLTAFLLVIVNVMAEIRRFLVALSFLLLMFASAISVLQHTYDDMSDVPRTMIALFAITIRLFEDDYRNFQEDPVLLLAVFAFVTASAILLLNLLIAQLNCSYVYIYQNMVGFARLKRAQVIVETMATCPERRWRRFVASLALEHPLEFSEGDVGISGGLQALEPASQHAVATDGVLRYGGSSNPESQWPEDAAVQEEDSFERMERLLQRTLKRISKTNPARQGTASSAASSLSARS